LSVTTAGTLALNDTVTLAGSTVFTAGTVLGVNTTLAAAGYDLTLAGGTVAIGDGLSLSARNLTLAGDIVGAGNLALDAQQVLAISGSLFTAGALDLGTPSLLALTGSIDSLGDILVASDMRLHGETSITSRGGGNVVFQGEINGASPYADSLVVYCSGLTAFLADVGTGVPLYLLRTDPPGTIQEAPVANALIVIYGETHDPEPEPESGGSELARSASAVWAPLPQPVGGGDGAVEPQYDEALLSIIRALLEDLSADDDTDETLSGEQPAGATERGSS